MGLHKGVCGPDRAPGSVMDVTLADYVQRKTRQEAFNAVAAEAAPKKLTFEEWLFKHIGIAFEDWDGNLQEDDLHACWKAAQENMP